MRHFKSFSRIFEGFIWRCICAINNAKVKLFCLTIIIQWINLDGIFIEVCIFKMVDCIETLPYLFFYIYDRRGHQGEPCSSVAFLCFITSVRSNLGWWGGYCMTRQMSEPLREKAALALAGSVFFAWPYPSLCHFWHLSTRHPPTPT